MCPPLVFEISVTSKRKYACFEWNKASFWKLLQWLFLAVT